MKHARATLDAAPHGVLFRVLPWTLATFALASSAAAQGAASIFEESAYIFLTEHSRLEYPADVDGDGDMELVGWWSYWSDYDPVQVFFWDQDEATGTWTVLEDTFSSGDYSYYWETATAVGDFDADGKDEMAMLHHWGIELFEPGPNGEPVRLVDQDYSPNISALDRDCAVGDLNGDGQDDVVLAAGPDVYLFEFVPGGFVLTDTFSTTGGHLSVVLADVVGDSDLEVVVLQEQATQRLRVLGVENMQCSLIHTRVLEPGAGGSAWDPVKIADGDVDGDGDTDLVLFGMGGHYQVARRDASGYQLEPSRVGGPATDLLDFDGDGDLDGLCCGGGGGGSFTHNDGPATFELCVNDGNGVFDVSVQFDGLGAEHVSGVLDYDADGDLDVLAGRAVLLNYSEAGETICEGTPNSSGQPAELIPTGRHSVAAGGPSFTVQGLPGSVVGVLLASNFDSASQLNDLPYYDGVLCLTGPFKRLRIVQANASGVALTGGPDQWNSNNWNGLGVEPSHQHAYQFWYRDGAAGQTGANFSSAVRQTVVE